MLIFSFWLLINSLIKFIMDNKFSIYNSNTYTINLKHVYFKKVVICCLLLTTLVLFNSLFTTGLFHIYKTLNN